MWKRIRKNVQREVEARAKDVKSLESEVIGLRGTLWDSVYGICDKFVEKARGFCPTAPIPVQELDYGKSKYFGSRCCSLIFLPSFFVLFPSFL